MTTSPELLAGAPRTLFRLPDAASAMHFVVLGQRFLIARRVATAAPPHTPLIVTENWTKELRRIVQSAAAGSPRP